MEASAILTAPRKEVSKELIPFRVLWMILSHFIDAIITKLCVVLDGYYNIIIRPVIEVKLLWYLILFKWLLRKHAMLAINDGIIINDVIKILGKTEACYKDNIHVMTCRSCCVNVFSWIKQLHLSREGNLSRMKMGIKHS